MRWVDSLTEEKLFDANDIVRFDWDKQVFELTRPAAMDFMTKLTRLDRKFDVVIENDILYSGSLVSPFSSKTYPHPVIVLHYPHPDSPVPAPPLFEIQKYYGEDLGEDVRFSEDLKKALSKADVLAEIDLNNPPEPIKIILN